MNQQGTTYDPKIDDQRIIPQRENVFRVMSDQRWRTLRDIAAVTGYPTPSISSRLRDFRKAEYGGHTVLRRRVDLNAGTWEYMLVLPGQQRLFN